MKKYFIHSKDMGVYLDYVSRHRLNPLSVFYCSNQKEAWDDALRVFPNGLILNADNNQSPETAQIPSPLQII